MSAKRLVSGTTAVVLVAVSVLYGSTAFARQQTPVTITAAQALTTALGAVPGTLLELELEREDGRAAYEMEIRPQAGGPVREVVVDASTGQVLSTRAEDDDSDEGAGAQVPTNAVQALNAALGAVPGTVREMELEGEDGRVAYEVEIRPQSGGPVREVLVDAASGQVLSTRVDSEDVGEAEGADADD